MSEKKPLDGIVDMYERAGARGISPDQLTGSHPLPRKDRNCSNCDFSRHAGREGLHCWIDPPEPCTVAMQQPIIATGPPRPVIIPILKPTFPWYCCRRWEMRKPDHIDYQLQPDAMPTHEGTEARQ